MYENYDAYSSLDGASMAGAMIGAILSLVFAVVMIIAIWKIYKKAGEHGWASIVPIYNLLCLGRIAYGKSWVGLLGLIPAVNGIFVVVTWFMIAKKFGKGTGFAIFSAIFSPIAALILGFGSSDYEG